VTFEDWGVHIYAIQDSDNSKMKARESFNGKTINAIGTLRYTPGSSSPRTDAGVPEHFFFDVAEAKVTTSHPAAEIKFREMHFRKPPLVELIFDVVLRNDRRSPRWFLLPSKLGPGQASMEKGGIDALEVYAPRGKGRVRIGHFLGTGGFQALLLPPHAEIRLRNF